MITSNEPFYILANNMTMSSHFLKD